MSSFRAETLRFCAVALGTVLAAILVILALDVIARPLIVSIFVAAVAVSAWQGGQTAGLLTMLLGSISTVYLLDEPYRSREFNIGGWIDLLIFFLVSTLVIHLVEKCRIAEASCTLLERKLEAVIESIDHPLSVLDHEWRLQHINRACARYFQLGYDELIGQVVWDLFPTTQGTLFEEYYRRAVREGVVVRFDTFHRASDCWLTVNAVPFDRGLIVGFHPRIGHHSVQNSLAACAQGSLRFRLTEPIPVRLSESEVVDAIYRYGRLESFDDAMSEALELDQVDSRTVDTPLMELFPRVEQMNTRTINAFIRSGFRLDHANLCRLLKDNSRYCCSFQLVGRVVEGNLVGITAHRSPMYPQG